ncbi:MAG: hypothetical protein EXS44_02215 [Candidatus Levybacteria bacterium]|nr:hypothetical protein [Candidatus Levybacteria bacterium]
MKKTAESIKEDNNNEISLLLNLAKLQKNPDEQYAFYVKTYEKLIILYEKTKDEKINLELKQLRDYMKKSLNSAQIKKEERSIVAIWINDLENNKEMPLIPNKESYVDFSFNSNNTHKLSMETYYTDGTLRNSLITLLPK